MALIALSKSPGVRPVGVGEVVRRIGKAVLRWRSWKLVLCAGQDAGCEAAIHAMCRVFSEDNTEAVLLVDASNAFNSLNCQTALHIFGYYPYFNDVYLFIDGHHVKSCHQRGPPTCHGNVCHQYVTLINALPDCDVQQT